MYKCGAHRHRRTGVWIRPLWNPFTSVPLPPYTGSHVATRLGVGSWVPSETSEEVPAEYLVGGKKESGRSTPKTSKVRRRLGDVWSYRRGSGARIFPSEKKRRFLLFINEKPFDDHPLMSQTGSPSLTGPVKSLRCPVRHPPPRPGDRPSTWSSVSTPRPRVPT